MYRSEIFSNDINRLFNEAIKVFKEYLALNVNLPYEIAFAKCHLPNITILKEISERYEANWVSGFDPYNLSLEGVFNISSVKIKNERVVVVYDYNNVENVVTFNSFDLNNKLRFIEGVCIFLDMADNILHPEKIDRSY